MRLSYLLAGLLAAAPCAWAAAPSQGSYTVNLGAQYGQPTFVPGALAMWCDETASIVNAGVTQACLPRPASQTYPLPVNIVSGGGGGSGGSGATYPAAVTVSAPTNSAVTTSGTAVQAFTATLVAKGGWISNPTTATGLLCISQSGTATTAQQGGTSCIAAGGVFQLAPGAAVSVNATDSGHAFSGAGYS